MLKRQLLSWRITYMRSRNLVGRTPLYHSVQERQKLAQISVLFYNERQRYRSRFRSAGSMINSVKYLGNVGSALGTIVVVFLLRRRSFYLDPVYETGVAISS
jgi:hypothetical protein